MDKAHKPSDSECCIMFICFKHACVLKVIVKRPVAFQESIASPTSVEIKKTFIYTSHPPYAFMALCVIK
jgi:hypothetical protein